ncbi:MAG: hypothetical protein HOI95_07630 [Chromatiales bacterium]|jgi:hypothetical protein|nr:hypothetical protein [Chromatiales bacterium]
MIVNPVVNNGALGAVRSSSGVQREVDGVTDQQRRGEDVPQEVRASADSSGSVGDSRSRVVVSADETQGTGLGRIREGEERAQAAAQESAAQERAAQSERLDEPGSRIDVFV